MLVPSAAAVLAVVSLAPAWHGGAGNRPCVTETRSTCRSCAAAGDSDGWHREAEKTIRRGSAAARLELATQLGEHDDSAAALDVALGGVVAAAQREAAARKARDTQGARMFKYYKKWVLRTKLPRERYTEYRMFEIENGRLCDALQEARAETDAFESAARAASSRITAEDSAVPGLIERIRNRVARARSDEAKSRAIAGLRGHVLTMLRPDLHSWAAGGGERCVVAAALSTLRSEPELVDPAALAPLAESVDPAVRRHAYRTLAVRPTVDSVDVLVDALSREHGVPAVELARLLADATGQSLGSAPEAWAEWWSGARAGWKGVASGKAEGGSFDATERSRYFGLSLHSARVVFVVDRSYSMDWPITHEGGDSMTAEDRRAEDKIKVAKRELLSALDGLDETTSFNIVAYGTKVDTFKPRLVPADARNLKAARRYVEKLGLEGSTNLSGALLEAMESTRPGTPARDDDIADTLVVLTDGEPNCGPIAEPDDLLAELRSRDRDGIVTVHAIFVGVAGDEDFMRRLASQGGGSFVHYKR